MNETIVLAAFATTDVTIRTLLGVAFACILGTFGLILVVVWKQKGGKNESL